jgi:hypothetical protein
MSIGIWARLVRLDGMGTATADGNAFGDCLWGFGLFRDLDPDHRKKAFRNLFFESADRH